MPDVSDVAAPPGGGPGIMAELGLEHWIDGDVSHGRAAVVPELWVPGTRIVRIGALALLADVISGQPAWGAISPTTDINVRVADVRPMDSVHLVSRVLKAGRTLVVCETLLMADDEVVPFAVSLSTFMNRLLSVGGERPRPAVRPLREPLHERIGARMVRPGTVELLPHEDLANDHHGTILGGVVAILAELAAESFLADEGPHVVTDLDVRFLNRVKVGPARAVARPQGSGPGRRDLGVEIRDAGDGDRMVSYATASGSPAPDAQ